VLPSDGKAVGEIEVRGPWITGSYYRDPAPEKFHDGWLRTGDVGTLDESGFLRLTDRSKDVIKSGGEWISSMELENLLMGHPSVAEAAVIGVPDEKWGERPLAAVVPVPGASVTPDELRSFLACRSGSCRSGGRSSRRSRRPLSASSPRSGCARPITEATTR
jgi:fatty-acyl-CoA synthase